MAERIRSASVAVSLFALVSVGAWGLSHRTVCGGFLPPNDLKIPVGDIHARGIAEDVFNKVLDRAEAVYKPIIAAQGGKLAVNRKWTDPTVNASANQSGGTWFINMYGGLARHATITEEGFALVACHEIGHHIGGFPKMRGWATNEGGADYFSTLKCLRRLLPDTAPEKVDAVAAAACDEAWPEGVDRNHCKSGAMAGMSVAALFQALRPSTPMPDFAKPDPAVVERTDNAHPAAQCRLDTYFQAALCLKPLAEELSNSDPSPGTCTEAGGFSKGLRPLCWYKPPPKPAAALAVAKRSPLMTEKSLAERLTSLRASFDGRGL